MGKDKNGYIEYCKEKHDSLFQCSFCHKYFCIEHLPQNTHYCTSISMEDLISDIEGRATLSEILLDAIRFATTMFIYAFILAVAIARAVRKGLGLGLSIV